MKEWRCLSALLLLSLSFTRTHTHKLTCIARRSFPLFFFRKPAVLTGWWPCLISWTWVLWFRLIGLCSDMQCFSRSRHTPKQPHSLWLCLAGFEGSQKKGTYFPHTSWSGAADAATRCRCGAVCCRSEACSRCCGRRYVTAQSKELIWLFGGLLCFPW